MIAAQRTPTWRSFNFECCDARCAVTGIDVTYEIWWYLVTWTSYYKKEVLVPTCSTWHSRCQATHCQQPSHHIKKYCLIRLRNLRRFWHSILWTLNWSHSSGMFCFDYCPGLKLKLEGRPVDGNKCVMLDMWLEYCAWNKFQGPNCLCPVLQTTNEEPPFIEAKILLKPEGSGDHIRECVAECLNGCCEYFGQCCIPR